MHTHSFGSRFYVYSHDPIHPKDREDREALLVAICHGFYKGAGMTTVQGVPLCAFFCDHGETVEVGALNKALLQIGREIRGNGGFWNNPTNTSGQVENYALTKEIDGKAKKSFKGQANYQFTDSSYIRSMYPAKATFDIVGVHNTWKSGRSVNLSELFETLVAECPHLYSRLYCGFCREEA